MLLSNRFPLSLLDWNLSEVKHVIQSTQKCGEVFCFHRHSHSKSNSCQEPSVNSAGSSNAVCSRQQSPTERAPNPFQKLAPKWWAVIPAQACTWEVSRLTIHLSQSELNLHVRNKRCYIIHRSAFIRLPPCFIAGYGPHCEFHSKHISWDLMA